MGFLGRLFGLPPAPKTADDREGRERYLRWVRKNLDQSMEASRKGDYARRNEIDRWVRQEAIPVLTLAEAVEIGGISHSWVGQEKAAPLVQRLAELATAGRIDQLATEIGRLQSLPGVEPGTLHRLLRLPHYEGRLRLLKISEAIKHDTLPLLAATPDGDAIFARERAAHRREEGALSLTASGVLFEGLVRINFPWTTVANVAIGGKDGDELAFQEGKRRTPTRFQMDDRMALERCRVIAEWLWKRRG